MSVNLMTIPGTLLSGPHGGSPEAHTRSLESETASLSAQPGGIPVGAAPPVSATQDREVESHVHSVETQELGKANTVSILSKNVQ